MGAPHINGDRIRPYFGWRRKVESPEMLENIAREEVPAECWREAIRRVNWRTGIIRVPRSTGERCLGKRRQTWRLCVYRQQTKKISARGRGGDNGEGYGAIHSG